MIHRKITVNELKELIYRYLMSLESESTSRHNALVYFSSRVDLSRMDENDFLLLYKEAVSFEVVEKISSDLRKILDSVGD